MCCRGVGLGGWNAGVGGRDAVVAGRGAVLGGLDAVLGGRDADLGGRDAVWGGRDGALAVRDVSCACILFSSAALDHCEFCTQSMSVVLYRRYRCHLTLLGALVLLRLSCCLRT